MISSSVAPRYSSTRLLTYSMSPSGPAVHTSVGIVSTSKRSSCSGVVSACRALLFSFEINPFMADPQIQTWVVGDAMSQRIADASAKGSAIILPPAPDGGQRPFGLFGTIDRAFGRGRSALKRCEIVQFPLGRPSGLHRVRDTEILKTAAALVPRSAGRDTPRHRQSAAGRSAPSCLPTPLPCRAR